MKDNGGYINVVAVMQSSLTKPSLATGLTILRTIRTMVPVSVMAKDLLTTFKLGWKTSYYQNTYDNKKDGDEEVKGNVEDLINDL